MKTTVMLLLSDWATLSKGPVSNFPSVLLALLLWLLLTWCGEAGDERLTEPCSFSALRLRFESKGKAGNAIFCSLLVSLFLVPLCSGLCFDCSVILGTKKIVRLIHVSVLLRPFSGFLLESLFPLVLFFFLIHLPSFGAGLFCLL
ncbi:hypothetical protein NC652_015548 [Populus alba x Populus x berolinensis]|uniref:Uncharacterized protein n=1 Tax=Populus davidiana TaxID=266767 RepID=A0A6M2F7S3_9ROSI|nr:hypothetical protein NC652_015548 [Populus alba x Populus x berolinensis]